jgi:hypothetical protein
MPRRKQDKEAGGFDWSLSICESGVDWVLFGLIGVRDMVSSLNVSYRNSDK